MHVIVVRPSFRFSVVKFVKVGVVAVIHLGESLFVSMDSLHDIATLIARRHPDRPESDMVTDGQLIASEKKAQRQPDG